MADAEKAEADGRQNVRAGERASERAIGLYFRGAERTPAAAGLL